MQVCWQCFGSMHVSNQGSLSDMFIGMKFYITSVSIRGLCFFMEITIKREASVFIIGIFMGHSNAMMFKRKVANNRRIKICYFSLQQLNIAIGHVLGRIA